MLLTFVSKRAFRSGSKEWLRIVKLLLIVIASLLCGSLRLTAQQAPALPIYLDHDQPVEQRIDDVISRMTLKEKVGQLNLPSIEALREATTVAAQMDAARKLTAGTYTDDFGPLCGFFGLASMVSGKGAREQAEYMNELQKIALTQTHLKIPLLEDAEGTHGPIFKSATVFPEGLAIGSTFDLPLVKAIYAAAAQEARAVGVHVLSTLVLELDRDPRMGRNEEGYTEDPFLGSRIAEQIVTGAQGTDISAPDKVIALMTDFPTQSEPVSGLERGAIEFSERYIRENVLPPWAAAFQAGALGVMAGYPEIEDEPAHASEKWMTDVLRHELGFKGIVMSEGDGFATLLYEHIVPTQKQAGALALRAGVDLDITYEPAYQKPLIDNVEEGRVPMALVDRAVRRVLRMKYQLGLFEHPYVDVDQAVKVMHSHANRDLALKTAREGIVLLKNERDVLPLSKNLKSIAVIGPNADAPQNMLGDYSPHPAQLRSIVDGIKGKVSSGTHVVYVKGCGIQSPDKSGIAAAVDAAKSADVAIVVVGETPLGPHGGHATDGEAYDVASLDLTGVQEDLVEAVYATGTPTVVVLVNGRPLSVRWIAAHVPALVEAWEPGEGGGEAIADVLFGDFNPSGRLPITIPRSAGQLPAYYNFKPSKSYWINDGWSHLKGYADLPGSPLYPFGYGLSYTRFAYSNLRVNRTRIYSGGNCQVSVDVQNTGSRAGVETVQLYVHEQYTPIAVPVQQLRGFARVDLAPGETKTVSFTLGPEDLQLLDRDMHWVVVPGTFDLMIGKSADDIALRGTLEVQSSGAGASD